MEEGDGYCSRERRLGDPVCADAASDSPHERRAGTAVSSMTRWV